MQAFISPLFSHGILNTFFKYQILCYTMCVNIAFTNRKIDYKDCKFFKICLTQLKLRLPHHLFKI